MRERDVEKKVSEYAKALGVTRYKFTSPNNRGVPDSIYLYMGRAVLIEFKHPDRPLKFDRLQQKQRDILAEAGCNVLLCNNVAAGCNFLNSFVMTCLIY